MDVLHVRRIRRAIREVMTGQLGPVKVPAGLFEYGAFAAMPLQARKTRIKDCKARHWFDVRFAPLSTNGSTTVGHTGSHAIELLLVEIEVLTHRPSPKDGEDRADIFDNIICDGDEARQALKHEGAIERTLAGEDTIVVSGMVVGPNGDTNSYAQLTRPDEDMENSIVSWSIIGSVLLYVPQNAPA